MDRTLAGVSHHQPLRLGRHELHILKLELQKGGREGEVQGEWYKREV